MMNMTCSAFLKLTLTFALTQAKHTPLPKFLIILKLTSMTARTLSVSVVRPTRTHHLTSSHQLQEVATC